MQQSPSPIGGNPCALCQSTSSYLIENHDRHGNELRVVVCGNCGVVHNDPIPTATELSRFYKDEYRQAYKKTREPKLRHSARYFPSTSKHIHKFWKYYQHAEKVLDIGSGSGEFVYLMRELGKDASGLEPTKDYAEFCQNRLGLNVVNGEIDHFTPPFMYDHIRLHHVVEHLRDPVNHLRLISSWLKKDGTIYVSVPDFERYCCVKTPGSIFHYGHIYNFDRDTFSYLVESACLRIVERTGPTSAFLGLREEPRCYQSKAEMEWPISQKIEFYQLHRAGKLRKKSRFFRFYSKAMRGFSVYKLIRSCRNHVDIATQVATQLRNSLVQ